MDPVSGSVVLKGASGTRNRSVAPVRILPGGRLHPLASRPQRGGYTATVALRQGGKRALTIRKRVTVR